ncbi:hypothetical protein CC79DRAFT_1328626 [Sarocladium strictum]
MCNFGETSTDGAFHRFAELPFELREQIWRFSFTRRVIELRARKAHYADAFRHGSVPSWQSYSNNPAALSVNAEARKAALRFYYIRIPLAAASSCDVPGDSTRARERTLCLNPAVDTVAMLGDLDFYRLSTFLAGMRHRDPAGVGLRSLAVSARWTSHGGAGSSIQMIVKVMFPDMDEFIVYLLDENFLRNRETNGTWSLEDCTDRDMLKSFEAEGGRHLRDNNDWIVIGKNKVRIMQLLFKPGWK